ncbi:hypothetical protein GCM10019016_062880 [Streptomyces prasinosporus]|uniref:Uncharacterized protein n=1 Tax=Streptomyces prasinosporus TaxID=68256 RepID=A0ABP6TVL5_9ACTN
MPARAAMRPARSGGGERVLARVGVEVPAEQELEGGAGAPLGGEFGDAAQEGDGGEEAGGGGDVEGGGGRGGRGDWGGLCGLCGLCGRCRRCRRGGGARGVHRVLTVHV